MNASQHQVHGKRVGGERVGRVLRIGGEANISVTGPLSWWNGREEARGLSGPNLARFAGEKRSELAALARAEATAGLRELSARGTWLATVRSLSPRLRVAPLPFTQDVSPEGTAPGALMASARDLELRVDEGGIFSW